ncbi:type II toxin-antitoxin system PemK/MazF family toxin [Myxosarcina sp. GI1]|uniref:type II toxin-antitoxin system PemK/MazF family toxin n=1 Tax=Myxosarcina sp. GI1 TaxID=1541065 RepID=UPI00209F674B|nr:type II toxin-antitoxin system PemK/MazF family toxin [Myxosarcina sp. GI1]
MWLSFLFHLGQHSLASYADAGSDRFSDLSQTKRRPALVVASLSGNDLILCQITSQVKTDRYAVAITNADFSNGGLNKNSNICPNRLFTADKGIILYKAGSLKAEKLKAVVNKIVEIISDD